MKENDQNTNNSNAPAVPEYLTKEAIKQQKKYNDNHSTTCRTLCMISLVCWALANLIFIVSDQFFDLLIDVMAIFTEVLPGLLLISGYVLAIIAIVRYPRSTFARVLVIIYITELILLFLMMLLLVIACSSAIGSCSREFISCLEMG
ncbi:hypothetical protein [Butyrivibrio fibrisolvens]|uniref:hypothetical protein n=1 Tax=Butyrivibrio fibrisolvens TaxID=831 RepID=UPI00041BA8D4|nr:hypothetical protein [Butyrivibrio fibrisolvens]